MIDLTDRSGMETTYRATAGDSLVLAVTITDEDGQLLDLTGYTFRYEIARSPQDTAILAKSSADPTQMQVTGVGTIEIVISANDTDDCVGLCYHELEITSPYGDVTTALAGSIEFVDELID